MSKNKISVYTFIQKANNVHNGKYNYTLVEYKNTITKVCIVCPIHGEFWQIPKEHMKGHGCPKCAKNYKMNNDMFIEKASLVHEGKYDYKLCNYINATTKVAIICKEHGIFYQKPSNHLTGQGCPVCGNVIKKDLNDFINNANKVHHNKYDYIKVKYVNNYTKVCIICPVHGEFYVSPKQHLKGIGCSKCSGKYSPTKDEFIKKAQLVHGERYDYYNVSYVNAYTKICIICPNHGEFYQTPGSHLNGVGCPKCKASKLEKTVIRYCTENNIEFVHQYKNKWLKLQSLDFYFPKFNIGLECQGFQHFKPVDNWGGENEFKVNIERDQRKLNLCKGHNLKLLYYTTIPGYSDFLGETLYTDIDKLFNDIINGST